MHVQVASHQDFMRQTSDGFLVSNEFGLYAPDTASACVRVCLRVCPPRSGGYRAP